MDIKLVERFMAKKDELEAKFALGHPREYVEVVKSVISILDSGESEGMDPERIHEIDDGDRQGTYVYVIGEKGERPRDYWYIKVSYGTCSQCDILEDIRGDSEEFPTQEQIKDYMTLALHIVQGLVKMGEEVI